MASIEEVFSILSSNIHIDKVYSNGFTTFKCRMCNDYKARAGIAIRDNNIVYNCFNCSFTASLNLEYKGISKRFLEFLNNTVDNSVISNIRSVLLLNDSDNTESKVKKTSIELPDNLIENDKECIKYLKSRGITTDLEFFGYKSGVSKYILFPVRDRSNQLVYWQARFIRGPEGSPRYLTYGEKKDVMYNIKAIYNKLLQRVYIFDGIFDCLSIYPYGISSLGPNINEDMINLLTQSGKEIVVVMDNDEQGAKYGSIALRNNFRVAQINNKYKDANELFKALNFNRILLLKELNNSIMDNVAAKHLIKSLKS